MMTDINTRLTYIEARKPDLLSELVQQLPYKVEIKNIVFANGKFYCFFVVPDGHREIKKERDA